MADQIEEGAPAVKPVAKIVPRADHPREKTVPLEWPVEFDGVVYDQITVKRCTGTEISEYIIARAAGLDALVPVISCPVEVYEALDADDLARVDEVVTDFLPLSFRLAPEPTPEASGNTSTKSGTPSEAAAPK